MHPRHAWDTVGPCARAAITAYEAREAWQRAMRAGDPRAAALYTAYLGRQEELRHHVVRWLRYG